MEQISQIKTNISSGGITHKHTHNTAKSSNMRYNFQEKHIFTFILDVKLFAVDTTGIASNDGEL
jgi:hypothetical protein